MRVLFFPVYWDDSVAARLEVAARMAELLEGHVVCAASEHAESGSREVAALTRPRRQEAIAPRDIRRRVEEHFQERAVPHSWISVPTLDAATLANAAQLSDLIIAPSRWSMSVPQSPRPADLLMRSTTSVLAVPPQAGLPTESLSALVAWDGSSSAATALCAAVPLLRMAERTVLVTVGEAAPDAPIDPLDFLFWQGISAEARYVPGRAKIFEALLAESASHNANLMVMGAYGRGRFVEELFGGITESMLKHSDIPIFAGGRGH